MSFLVSVWPRFWSQISVSLMSCLIPWVRFPFGCMSGQARFETADTHTKLPLHILKMPINNHIIGKSNKWRQILAKNYNIWWWMMVSDRFIPILKNRQLWRISCLINVCLKSLGENSCRTNVWVKSQEEVPFGLLSAKLMRSYFFSWSFRMEK